MHRSHLTGARARGVRRVRSLGAKFRQLTAYRRCNVPRLPFVIFFPSTRLFQKKLHVYLYIYISIYIVASNSMEKIYTSLHLLYTFESMDEIYHNKRHLIVHGLDYRAHDSSIKTITPKFETLFYRYRDRFEHYASMLELIKRNEFIRFLAVEKGANASSHDYYAK